MGSLFTDLTGAIPEADRGTPPTPLANIVRPDERAIAVKFAEANAQKHWMIVEHRGRAVEWYRNDAGIWVRDGLSIGDDVSRQCARVSDVIRANPNATQQEQTLARSLQGDTVSKHVVNMVKNMPSMHTPIAKLDARRWLLGFKGGYVDEDNRLRDPDPSLYITKQLGVIPIFQRTGADVGCTLGKPVQERGR
jgi:hypothetical protein